MGMYHVVRAIGGKTIVVSDTNSLIQARATMKRLLMADGNENVFIMMEAI